MAQNIAVIPKYPEEFNYTLPSGIPSGLKQVQLRQLQYGQIPGAGTTAGTPAGTEIQIILPQLNGCFLDTTTSYINVRATLYGNLLNSAAGSASFPVSDNSYALCALKGSAWSLFSRYQVYANTTTLTDDINEVGVLIHWLYLLTLDSASRRSSPQYGLDSYAYDSSLKAIGGMAFSAAGDVLNLPSEQWLKNADNTLAWSNPSNNITGVYCKLNFVLPVPGTLGSGNDKMYPLFVGPTRISLLTDSVQNIFLVNGGVAGTLPVYPTGTNLDLPYFDTATYPTGVNISFDEVEFVGNYIQCDQASFGAIMSSLPQGQIVMRTLGFAQSSYNIPAQTLGQHEGLISTRRASMKFLLASVYPSDAALGKFAGVNPFATINTALTVNGVLYPQMTIDPTSKWNDYKNQVETALQVAHTTGNKTTITSTNWFVGSDGLAATERGFNLVSSTAKGGDNIWSKYYRGTSIAATGQLMNPFSCPQFCFVFDTEHFAKRGFIAGVGTLSGSTFLRLQLKYATPITSTVNCYNFHDQILVFDIATRSVSIKV